MSEKHNYYFCLLLFFISCVFCLFTLVITTLETTDLAFKQQQFENEMRKEIEAEKELNKMQDNTIRVYKNYVDDVTRCVVDGTW